MKACVRQTMAFPAFPASVLWTLGSLTILWASVQSNVVMEDDPFQPVTTDETVSVGGTVTLTCRVMESDNSSLQWSNTAQQTLYFGDKRALRDNRIQLHRSTPTELSITIADVQLSDDGDYTCSIFTKPIRTARATVTVLGVPGKPQILTNNEAVQEGGTVTLICSSSGGKPAAKLRWYKDKTELTGSTETVQADPNERTFTVRSELQLPVTRGDNKAVVACTVDHPSLTGGDETTEEELSVLYSPIVHIEPETNLPREGAKFYLQCIGDGNPDPSSFLWEKKDGSLPSLVKADGSFLRFEQLNKSDNGVYLCQVDNGIGTGLADYALLVQDSADSAADPTAMSTSSGVDHAVIGGVVAVIVFILLCLLIVLGRYLIRHKGTYLTHEAKGSDDAPDADTAIINAEGGHSGADDKKEYFI
ncbi:cell adhesion molecule 3 isoform X2 [Anguilla rostrata]|uniref:cell adhesion molecule 3 isoform X2 n=1 Tax=Anguilla rostrata TaxID=7938 RepID=UPI0030D2143E